MNPSRTRFQPLQRASVLPDPAYLIPAALGLSGIAWLADPLLNRGSSILGLLTLLGSLLLLIGAIVGTTLPLTLRHRLQHARRPDPRKDSPLLQEVHRFCRRGHTPVPEIFLGSNLPQAAEVLWVHPHRILLIDEKFAQQTERQQRQAVLAHEIAHLTHIRRLTLRMWITKGAALSGAWTLAANPRLHHHGLDVLVFVASALLTDALLVRRTMREEEFRADRLARAWVGEGRSLAKYLLDHEVPTPRILRPWRAHPDAKERARRLLQPP